MLNFLIMLALVLTWLMNKLMYQYFFVFEMQNATKLVRILRWICPFYGFKDVSDSLGVTTGLMSICIVLVVVGFVFEPSLLWLTGESAGAEVDFACKALIRCGVVGLLINWIYLEMKLISSLRMSRLYYLALLVCPFLVDLSLIRIMSQRLKERE